MDDEELGLDTFTELNDTGRSITISTDATGKKDRMQLNVIGTPSDPPEQLYHHILKAFEDAVEDSKK